MVKKHKVKIVAAICIAAVLAFVFWYGGDAPGLRGLTPEVEESVDVAKTDMPVQTQLPSPSPQTEPKPSRTPAKSPTDTATTENPHNTPMTLEEKAELAEGMTDTSVADARKEEDREYSLQAGMILNRETGKDKYMTEPVPDGKPLPIEPQNVVISDKEYTCTLSVRCDTILENISWLDKEKVNIVPKDGVIFAEKTVTFYEGESVFNLLVCEMKRNNIHMEFENTPIYNSAYIEGIANLYEFDCGELSGWMYKVNGWFPNYGCSRYQLKAGDRVEWVYTCDLGMDISGYYSSTGE